MLFLKRDIHSPPGRGVPRVGLPCAEGEGALISRGSNECLARRPKLC